MAYLLAPPDSEIHPQPEIGGKGTDLLDKSGYRDRKGEESRGEERGGPCRKDPPGGRISHLGHQPDGGHIHQLSPPSHRIPR